MLLYISAHKFSHLTELHREMRRSNREHSSEVQESQLIGKLLNDEEDDEEQLENNLYRYNVGTNMARSTSAPPQLGIRQDEAPFPPTGNPDSSKEDYRLTPEYYAYYYRQRPIDPRLPPPLVNWSSWHFANNLAKDGSQPPSVGSKDDSYPDAGPVQEQQNGSQMDVTQLLQKMRVSNGTTVENGLQEAGKLYNGKFPSAVQPNQVGSMHTSYKPSAGGSAFPQQQQNGMGGHYSRIATGAAPMNTVPASNHQENGFYPAGSPMMAVMGYGHFSQQKESSPTTRNGINSLLNNGGSSLWENPQPADGSVAGGGFPTSLSGPQGNVRNGASSFGNQQQQQPARRYPTAMNGRDGRHQQQRGPLNTIEMDSGDYGDYRQHQGAGSYGGAPSHDSRGHYWDGAQELGKQQAHRGTNSLVGGGAMYARQQPYGALGVVTMGPPGLAAHSAPITMTQPQMHHHNHHPQQYNRGGFAGLSKSSPLGAFPLGKNGGRSSHEMDGSNRRNGKPRRNNNRGGGGASGGASQEDVDMKNGGSISKNNAHGPPMNEVGQRMYLQGSGSERDQSNTNSGAAAGGDAQDDSGFASLPSSTRAFLEEFRLNKGNSNLSLGDVVERRVVVELATMDQCSSRFIQKKLETASVEEKQAAFEQLLPDTLRLCTDAFGNYVIQKFFEHGGLEHRQILANQLVGNVMVLSLQMYGCRVVQKAIDVSDPETQALLVRELAGHVMTCVKDQNGNHVIQKCIEKVPSNLINFIVAAFNNQIFNLSTHPYGCRVIQRLLEHCSETQRNSILTEILDHTDELCKNQYGNYVVQHVLSHGTPLHRGALIAVLRGRLVALSKHKFASNVVEKCFTHANRQNRMLLLEEVLGKEEASPNSPLLSMVKDQYGNYVVQKIIDVVDPEQRQLIVHHVRRHIPNLRKIPYGKHIIARIEKITGKALPG